MDIVLFIVSFALILIGCEFFTNGVEWLGKRLNLAEGAIGSVLAAIGTAMPETLVPLIAILLVGGETGEDIGAGAILGSPFMLSTLALFVCGMAVMLYAKRRGRTSMSVNGGLVRRDLRFFLIAYGMAAAVAFVPTDYSWLKWIVGLSLIPLYFFYMSITLRGGGSSEENDAEDLYLARGVGRINGKKKTESEVKTNGMEDEASEGFRKAVYESRPSLVLIIVQIAMGLTGILLGATLFVEQIQALADIVGLSPLILALIVAPIATELPEMYNCVIWIRQKKDIYAIGNITGAMVFQSCVPVMFGVLLTTWHLDLNNATDRLQALAIFIALLSATILYLRAKHDRLTKSGLILGGAFYLIFMILVLFYA
ncbi:MAG TPA: hypothetical protein VLH13_02865 [Methanomassiliicoccales archaeon]|nr:hypothetical protein [Methanomassiliicoccales archaeon]